MMSGKFRLLAVLFIIICLGVLSNSGSQGNDTNTGNTQESAIINAAQSYIYAGSDTLVTFIELGSVNCIPCKKMQPVMKKIEEKFPNQVKIVFHDVWTKEGRPYAKKYNIRVIPTQVFLDKDGKEFFRHQGFFPYEEIVKILKKQGVKTS